MCAKSSDIKTREVHAAVFGVAHSGPVVPNVDANLSISGVGVA